jgi:hypothetical protein
MPRITIESLNDVYARHAEVLVAARKTSAALARLLTECHGIDLIHELKFREVAFSPFQSAESYNLIELVNQSFTALVSLAGTRRILRDHPSALPIQLNLGPVGGHDIWCEARGIVAECFAAVTPDNNNKLQAEVDRLRQATQQHKYLFFYSPAQVFRMPLDISGISLVGLSLDELYFLRQTEQGAAPDPGDIPSV